MSRKTVKKVIIFILVAVMLQGVFVAYAIKSSIDNKSKDNGDKEQQKIEIQGGISAPGDMQGTKRKPKDVDISKAIIPADIEDEIKKNENKNADKHIKNFKRMIVKLDVPGTYISEVGKHIKNKKNISDLFIAYEFLYENYGKISDIGMLLDEKDKNVEWAEVFKGYLEKNGELQSTRFEEKYLEGLLNDPKLSMDDVVTADRVSQRSGMKFAELIESKKSGKTWKDINSGLGIVFTSEKLQRFSLDGNLVKKYTGDGKISKEDAIKALTLAEKMEIDDDIMISRAKEGRKKNELFAVCLEERYK